MSKHRHKSDEGKRMGMNQFNRPFNNNPFGISPQQLLGLLGSNIDMTGLGNILSSMGSEGFDLNSVNNQMNQGNFNNPNMNMQNSFANMDGNTINQNKNCNNPNNIQEENSEMQEDENIKFLLSIKSIANPERIEFIDKIIELYNKGAFKNNKKK
ncbi:MAG: hypothetical protein E7214_11915 [Clostridium sp.]|nr:hypothetical protein [Clostridium sp.]